jgi:ADP-dependent NAD(P)H-hydrate dehydratase / NAD(P)H-hydrate epimerase
VKPVLTPAEAAELDRATQAAGIPDDVLMERSGRAVARAALDLMGGAYGRRVVVVAGPGNNGGDGLVAARYLARRGVRVRVMSVAVEHESAGTRALNLGRLADAGIAVHPLEAQALAVELARSDLAIDAVFGIGFHGVPRGEFAVALSVLDAGSVPIVAVDIPSGVDAGTGAVPGVSVRAELTVTFGAVKVGAVLLPGAEVAGAVRVVDIGFPEELVHADTSLMEPADVAAALPHRAQDGHKRASGTLLVVAGSRGMTGAVSLIARAAGRIGTGLVSVAVPEGILPVVQAAAPEAVFIALPETEVGTVDPTADRVVFEALERADTLAIGPGLTNEPRTGAFVRSVVGASSVPMVVDADGLNAFAGRVDELAERRSAAVITPHFGEFARLRETSVDEIAADRLGHTRALAHQADAVTLLKGSRTVVATPEGTARINPTGSPFLATAGSGDVLTGMVGGLMARGLAPPDAASVAAYLHGLAGLIAGRQTGEGTLAGDLVRRIPDAVARVMTP